MIGALGALHCITKEVGTNDPLLISHQSLPNTTDTLNSYTVSARIQHRSGIATATLFWRTDTLQPWQSMSMNPAGTFIWDGAIPAQAVGTKVYYYIGATAVSGKSQVRPLPAPSGYWRFEVTGTTSLSENNSYGMKIDVFPNPCRGITCVSIENKLSLSADIMLYDATGRMVQPISTGVLKMESNKFFFDASPLSAGVYFIRIQTDQTLDYRKIVVQH